MKRDLTSVDVKSHVSKQWWVRYEQDWIVAPSFVDQKLKGRLDCGDNAKAKKRTSTHTIRIHSHHTVLHGESDFFFDIGRQSLRKLHWVFWQPILLATSLSQS